MRIKMHATVDSGCHGNAQPMCELPKRDVYPLPRKWLSLWRRSGDGRALRTHAPLTMEGRTIRSGLSIGREESQRIVSGRSLTTGLRGSLDAHFRGLAVIRQFDCGNPSLRICSDSTTLELFQEADIAHATAVRLSAASRASKCPSEQRLGV